MAYETYEISDRLGEPVEFFKISIPSVATYRYTSADTVQSYLSEDYEPLSTLRDAPKFSRNSEDGQIKIPVPPDLPLFEDFRTQPPHERIFVNYFRQHRADPEVKGYYAGFVGGIEFKDEIWELTVLSFDARMNQISPADVWQPNCRYYVFDGETKGGRGCPVPSANYKRTGVITSQSGDTLTSTMFSAETDGWFALGWVEAPSGRRSMILTHAGASVQVLTPFQESLIGLSVDAYPGCNGLLATCQDKFGADTDNGERHGGHPRIPKENPSEKGIR